MPIFDEYSWAVSGGLLTESELQELQTRGASEDEIIDKCGGFDRCWQASNLVVELELTRERARRWAWLADLVDVSTAERLVAKHQVVETLLHVLRYELRLDEDRIFAAMSRAWEIPLIDIQAYDRTLLQTFKRHLANQLDWLPLSLQDDHWHVAVTDAGFFRSNDRIYSKLLDVPSWRALAPQRLKAESNASFDRKRDAWIEERLSHITLYLARPEQIRGILLHELSPSGQGPTSPLPAARPRGSSWRPAPGPHRRVTFSVADVEPATEPLDTVPLYQALGYLRPLETCSDYFSRVVPADGNCLAFATYRAFMDHRPLVLSPDAIWLTLVHGLAQHVNANAEALRHHFVHHEEKLTLLARCDDFVLGSPENPWDEVFEDLSGQVRGHLGESTHDLFLADYSTTGRAERTASEVMLLDAMQAYFEYVAICICGIPQIALEGTVQDWERIAERFAAWRRFDLAWWVDAVLPILAQFVRASSGDVDRGFWQDIYQRHDPDTKSYGGPYEMMTGWLGQLFPYLGDRNPLLADPAHPVRLQAFPAGIGRAPLLWVYRERKYPMEILAGPVALEQESDLALRPKIAWVVRHALRPQA